MAVIIVRPQTPRSRRVRWGITATIVLIVALIAWNWSSWSASAKVAAAYGAKIGCGCRYVEGRSAESCKGDIGAESGMSLVSINDDKDAKAVSGHVWLMARRTARLKPGFGCVLDPM